MNEKKEEQLQGKFIMENIVTPSMTGHDCEYEPICVTYNVIFFHYIILNVFLLFKSCKSDAK